MIKDLTYGEPIKLMMIFSIPLLIGNIFQQFYNIADIIIVGRTLGINALAAVGAVSPLFFFNYVYNYRAYKRLFSNYRSKVWRKGL